MNRLDLAERQLDRVQAFHSRIDAKVAAVAAWLLLELGIVAANTKLTDVKVTFVWVPLAAFVICLMTSAVALWKCLFPDQRGGASSLIYFARIAERTETQYVREFNAADENMLLNDFLGQVWRNAEIVCEKYKSVSRAIRWATFSLVALLCQIVAVSFIHQALPILNS